MPHDFKIPQFTIPEFKMPEMPVGQSPAEAVFEDLREMITAFQHDLDADHELGIVVPGSEPLLVERIKRQSGLVLAFHGTTGGGRRATLLQHVSQRT